MSNQRLINAGATLANIAFNLAQRDPGEFTARDIVALGQARKDWDAARSEPEPTPAPGAPGQEAADARDAARWRYAVAIGGNQCMNWLDVYDDWDGDGDFADAIDAAAGAGEKTS